MDLIKHITLTPNSRLARHLKRQPEYAIATVLPLQAWLQTLYQDCLFHGTEPLSLLNAAQELSLWQNIIDADEHQSILLQSDAVAQTAQQAYATLQQWCLALDTLANQHLSADCTRFVHWAHALEQHCRQQHYLLPAQLLTWLSNHLGAALLPSKVTLYQFDEIPPALKNFIAHLPTLGCDVETLNPTQTVETQQLFTAETVNDELQTMTSWAKAIHTQNADAKILCVVPNLNQLRPELIHTFQKTFFPEQIYNPDFTQEIYNISGGYPLHSAPVVSLALLVLNCSPYSVNYQTLSQLLTTPFLQGYQSEQLNRASLDKNLRELDEPELSWRLVFNQLAETNEVVAQQFINQLQQWHQLRSSLTNKLKLVEWVEHFHTLLLSIGWPGERTFNSTEYQQVQKLFAIMQALPQQVLQDEPISYQQALQQLNKTVRNTLFEIQSHDGTIQVLGLLEAAGLNADHIWVMQVDDETWPAAARPNPLLPAELQRQQSMPHSSAEREYQFNQQMLQRLQQSCQHLIVSYHQHDADRELNISPLLQPLTLQTFNPIEKSDTETLAEQISNSTHCVEFVDQQAPQVASTEKTPGGTGLFKAQAACPFQAFARYRLYADDLPQPQPGLNALQRGLLLHASLEHIWQSLGQQQALLAINNKDLHTLVETAIETAFSKTIPAYSRKLSSRLKTIEKTRLLELLTQWLDYEKQRPPFKVIANERWQKVAVGKLTLNVQIDRIDELDCGEQLVIDYKSGKTTPNNWFGERPREPQLPLYCVTNQAVNGIAFAQVRNDEMKFKGIAVDDMGIDGIKSLEKVRDAFVPEHWSALTQQWRDTLQRLADNFFAGDARVDPAFYDTCAFCELHSLCRIGEQS